MGASRVRTPHRAEPRPPVIRPPSRQSGRDSSTTSGSGDFTGWPLYVSSTVNLYGPAGFPDEL